MQTTFSARSVPVKAASTPPGRLLSRFRHAFKLIILTLALATAASAGPASDSNPITVSGITEPFLDVTLSAPVSGIISARRFEEGDSVKEGDVLIELDRKLEEFEVDRRKAVMELSKMQLDSTRTLVTTTSSVSKEELAKKEAEYQTAKAEYEAAEEELARRRLRAPFAGSIVEINLEVGAACAPYQPLVRLVDTSRCYFVGQIEGRAVSGLHLGEAVQIQIEGTRQVVLGRICFISPVVDPASGLARVKALFDNASARIRPGLAARMIPEPGADGKAAAAE
jgi:RND family efflux transporter MFP subunit